MARNTHRRRRREGVSLAKGPVGLLGLLGVIYGVSALILGGHGFALHVPHGAAHGKQWLGLEVNGWSDLLLIAGGLLLLFAAPVHWGAKGMSLLVGVTLGAAAVIALIRGNGVFGIFAANGLTELVWGAAGVLLLLLSLLPRVGSRGQRESGASKRAARHQPRAATREPASSHTRWLDDADEQDRPPTAGATKTDDDTLSSRRTK